MQQLYNCLQSALDWLVPDYCVLCRKPSRRRLALCPPCAEKLPKLDSGCPRCALPGTMGHVCGRCQKTSPAFDLTIAPFAYAEPVSNLIWRLKFRADLHLARLLGTLIAEHAMERRIGEIPDLIVPVPLHRRRLMRRGFNQSAEIARTTGKMLGIPVDTGMVMRSRATTEQHKLAARHRRKNVRDAFVLQKTPKRRRIALIDDVMTSGATLDALAGAFKQAGDVEIQCWVFARA